MGSVGENDGEAGQFVVADGDAAETFGSAAEALDLVAAGCYSPSRTSAVSPRLHRQYNRVVREFLRQRVYRSPSQARSIAMTGHPYVVHGGATVRDRCGTAVGLEQVIGFEYHLTGQNQEPSG